MRRLGMVAFGLLFFLGLWQLIILIFGLPRFILPSPLDVAAAFADHASFIMGHAAITAIEVVVGFVLGCFFGVANALMIINSAFARRYVFPVLVASQAVPVFAIAPILTLWFGFGVASKIIMTMLVIYFPVTSNFLDGLNRTPQPLLDMAGVMGGSQRNMLIYVRIPMALPSLVSGVRLAAIFAPIGAVVGEWVGASGGLGYLMLYANGRVKTDLMFAAIITLGILAIIFLQMVQFGLKKSFPWIPQSLMERKKS